MTELGRESHFTNRGLRRQKILTKGDNNEADDTLLFPAGQRFVDRDEIVGVVAGSVPFLGWATILFSEYPWLKLVAIAALPCLSLLG